jgi:hypothetical protein
MLMIVFPSSRWLELQVGRASSMKVVIPTFGRSRPSLTRAAISDQLGAVGHGDEVHRASICEVGLDRAYDGDQGSLALTRAAERFWTSPPIDVEDQIDLADVLQRVAVEVDTILRAEVERLLSIGGASVPMT